ncbi:larval cuticle protein 65Ag1-like [Drosophila hydei]|uniref:Larval cuticle protein 65Ag1-like n=1 Tax=Drosophila hydei TaxID=7224 RepID=A0A6J1LYC4_DROHY|nr:larval cuticle protein 65Ag1-like [Drosophila hydei]
MKFLIVFVALFALALAAPPAADVSVVEQKSDVQADGFKAKLVLSNGVKEESEGQLKDIGTENEAFSVKGSYSFVDDDGVTYEVNYIADENGFQPQGAHLPVA